MRNLQFESVAFLGALGFLVVGASLALFSAGGKRARSTRLLVAGALLLASSGVPELVDWATRQAAWFWSYVAVTLMLWGGAFLTIGFRLIHEADWRPWRTVLFASALTLLLWLDLSIQGYMLGYRSAIVMVGLFFMAASLAMAPRKADPGVASIIAFRVSMLIVASIASIRAVAGFLDPARDAFLSNPLDTCCSSYWTCRS